MTWANQRAPNANVRQWMGLKSNLDEYSMPPGSFTEQTNLTHVQQGRVEGRGGMRELEFEN